MATLKFYMDPVSPVCRSVQLFMEANGIPYETVSVSLKNHETQTNPELIAINPGKRIPAIDDKGFKMFESTAILQYLSEKYQTPDHWYPKDVEKRAKVNEALSWFPGNLRCGAFYHSAVLPVKTGQPVNTVKVAETTGILKQALDIIENYFLKDRQFVAGDEISIADLQFIGETTQYWMSGNDLTVGRPNMEKWVARVMATLGSHFEKVYEPVYKVQKAGTFTTKMDL